ncbi:MAG: damage-inducible protein DinB [Kaistella sp.]|nr:damage-inducible protein DinB [Kaistella sp.]
MDSLPHLRKELQQEYETTKKFFALFPEEKNDYAPHEKSMKLMPLATHVAEIFGWPDFMLKTEKLDFAAGDYQPTFLTTKKELQQKLEDDYANSKKALENITEEDLNGRWTMNVGEKQLADYNKYEAIRVALDQITHHRAQLGVYYRLLDIPLPGSYGPTADDESF